MQVWVYIKTNNFFYFRCCYHVQHRAPQILHSWFLEPGSKAFLLHLCLHNTQVEDVLKFSSFQQKITPYRNIFNAIKKLSFYMVTKSKLFPCMAVLYFMKIVDSIRLTSLTFSWEVLGPTGPSIFKRLTSQSIEVLKIF